MSAISEEEDAHRPRRLSEWNLPVDLGEFLDWLRDSGVPGGSDVERVAAFQNNPAAADVPDSLRQSLGLLLGEPF